MELKYKDIEYSIIPDFIFTKNGFQIDITKLDTEQRDMVQKTWDNQNGFFKLYNLTLKSKSEEFNDSLRFLVSIADTFFSCLTKYPELELVRENIKVEIDDINAQKLLQTVPFVIGFENVTKEWIQKIFDGLQTIFSDEISNYNGKVEAYLAQKSTKLHISERIFFHLVENKDFDYPFAFMATYATKTQDGNVRHMPLEYALTEFKNSRNKLIELLSCLNNVSKVSNLIATLMESGELFVPIKLTSDEAYEFLKQIQDIEAMGILCRIPNWWRKRTSSITKTMKLGEEEPAKLGFDTLVSLTPTLTVDGQELSKEDIKNILSQSEGLAFLKGKWIEVDHERLKKLLEEIENSKEDISFIEALRMNATINLNKDLDDNLVSNGQWLSGLLNKLSNPQSIEGLKIPKTVKATLRPYQLNGYKWLNYMQELKFGACLADDMGLGKTLQVLSYLENVRLKNKNAKVLLIVQASLLGNWEKEIQKFVPKMPYNILHGEKAEELGKQFDKTKVFLNITTYKMALKIKELENINWDIIILDEAQVIKNPKTKQTKQIKKLKSDMRIAMTGTPIENDLTNLWSLFDFLNKGLLGTSTEFKKFCKDLKSTPQKYSQLKNMISPFLLRRIKLDKNVIDDLPEKFEMIKYSGLSKKQVVLYKKVVSEMENSILESSGINRKGLILSAIMKLKQICNHPDQYLGQTEFLENDSGKFAMLRELCETIYEKRERVLVFTQFKEITQHLSQFLSSIFNAKGFVLHGSTPVKERNKMVESFQSEKYIPFMVLSVKAGGTGLNLTNANHVIHFDRWWNPAVENQATDRAFRIGQSKDVMVHKLVCKDTIEEKIDEIIESKKELAGNLIGSNDEKWITNMSNEEIINLLKLDL